MVEKPLRNWRVMRAEPSGCLVWFDPSTEVVQLFSRDSEGPLTGEDECVRFGESVSVSASEAEARAGFGNHQLDLLDSMLSPPLVVDGGM